jgi:hypothetical protein
MKPLPAPCILSVSVPVCHEAAPAREALAALPAKAIAGGIIEVILAESNSTDGSREIMLGYRDPPRVAESFGAR